MSPKRPKHARFGRRLECPRPAVQACEGLTSNFSASGYLDAVQRTVDYICAGDVFQVNLAQRLLHPADDDSASLYLRLRRRNPAPFAGYFDVGEFQIVSASPERFLQAKEKAAEPKDVVKGLAAAAGIADGTARVVKSPEEFNQVKQGEIMVCIGVRETGDEARERGEPAIRSRSPPRGRSRPISSRHRRPRRTERAPE